jgi:hypothetical protein
MELKDTVTFFSSEVFTDAYNPYTTFMGKLNPFSEITNSGPDAQRRILETPVDVTIPEKRVITSPSGQTFIVAAKDIDFWKGASVRHKYPVLPITGRGYVGSIGNILNRSPADASVYGATHFSRRVMDDSQQSDYLSSFEVYFSSAKTFKRSQIYVVGGEAYRMKTDTWLDGAGFSVAQAVKLENPLRSYTIVYDKEVYDPATDSHPGLTLNEVLCFVEPLRQDYDFVTPSFSGIEEGDLSISLLDVATGVGVNDRIGDYRIISIRKTDDWVTCQCRHMS